MLAFITRQPECGWNFQPPRVKSEKLCLALEQKCPDSDLVHEEPLLRELCSFYVVPACTNPHCDICKGEGIEWYACEAPRTGGEGSHYSMPPPLNILFDFSSSCHSLQVGDRKTVIKNKRCSENFVFDPVAEKCVQIYFPISNFEIIDSRNFGVSKNNSYINGSQVENKINCSHVKVNISSVTYLSNGSIWISLHKRMYNKERYFINGTSVFLCADFKRAYTVTEELASTEISPLQIVTYIGCIISMISLIALLGIYIALPELRTLPGKNLISLSCAMLLYHIFFLLTDQTSKPNLCMAVSVLLHYFLLSSFCWMGVMAFDVKKTFGVKGQARSGNDDNRKALVRYSIFAWTTPAVIVLMSVTLDKTNTFIIGYAKVFCWISNGKALLLVLGVPVAIILLFNVVALTCDDFNLENTKVHSPHGRSE